LVADDERASRDLLEKALTQPDRRITVARDGNSAVELLDREKFDVVVTDLNMPGVNGVDVFRHAMGLRPATQVIFITGYGSLEMVEGAINDGAYDFVAKPFKLVEMQLVVRNACDKVRLLKEVGELREQLMGGEGKAEFRSHEGDHGEIERGAAGGGNAGRIGEYARAARDAWLHVDARLALERLRDAGDISAEEFSRLESRLPSAGRV
jgi:DNA-binding response OmpR family regulator